MKGLNVFSTHAPKPEWIKFFFDNGNNFFNSNHQLAEPQLKSFKHFLIDSELIASKTLKTTNFFELIKKIG